ncbi:MAG TPA: hypothetical protein VFA07_03660 [Chthonomonadaceae bacterium]|nr:hypothetical protein [Chthonomonadaceae bacterium]
MIQEALQIEGTWEQIAALGKSLAGRRVRLTVLPSQAVGEPAEARPIEEVFAEIMADMPEEERAKLPSDLAEQHDHYIYGWPKR